MIQKFSIIFTCLLLANFSFASDSASSDDSGDSNDATGLVLIEMSSSNDETDVDTDIEIKKDESASDDAQLEEQKEAREKFLRISKDLLSGMVVFGASGGIATTIVGLTLDSLSLGQRIGTSSIGAVLTVLCGGAWHSIRGNGFIYSNAVSRRCFEHDLFDSLHSSSQEQVEVDVNVDIDDNDELEISF